MMVRVRLGGQGAADLPRLRGAALATAALLAPSSLVAFTVSFWGFAADHEWTSGFFISRGLFAHWQVWMVAAAVLLLLSRLLNGYAEQELRGSSDSSV